MVYTIPAQNLSLYDLKAKFGLQLADNDQFFREWLDNLPELTHFDKQVLDQVKANYLHVAERPVPEDIVKMVVLSPLLDLAGFYRSPFQITSAVPVKISAENDGEIVQGRIDVLVLQEQFWILVIESKRNTFSLELAIPQALAYMLGDSDRGKPTFGLVTTGVVSSS